MRITTVKHEEKAIKQDRSRESPDALGANKTRLDLQDETGVRWDKARKAAKSNTKPWSAIRTGVAKERLDGMLLGGRLRRV